MRQAGLPLAGQKELPTTRLIYGDCLKIMPTLPANSVQMVFADLPYRCTKNAWDVLINFDKLWAQIRHLRSDTAPTLLTCTQPFTTFAAQSNLKELRYDLVWQKSNITGFFMAKRAPLRDHETILFFAKSIGTYNPQRKPVGPSNSYRPKSIYGTKSRSSNYGGSGVQPHRPDDGTRLPRSVVKIASEARQNSKHPTQKPVSLLEWLVLTYTDPGDTVLDPTAGSGTTAIAALRTGRHSICIEKDKGYYDAMCKRVAEERERLQAGG